MAESIADAAGDQPVTSSNRADHQTPEELVAKAIAPVKREFLRHPPSRTQSDAVAESRKVNAARSGVVNEKKSKRQLKRERRQVACLNFSLPNTAKFQYLQCLIVRLL